MPVSSTSIDAIFCPASAPPANDDSAALGRVLDRVVDQVVENLAEAFLVGPHEAARLLRLGDELDSLGVGGRPMIRKALVDHFLNRHRHDLEHLLRRLDPRERQHVENQMVQPIGLLLIRSTNVTLASRSSSAPLRSVSA